MSRRVVISGLGVVSGLGIGLEANWSRLCAGESAAGPIGAFDASGFDCRIACEVGPYKIADHVPKSYRKATKVMARDIELAVIAAEQAALDAGLRTPGTDPDAARSGALRPSYEPERVGCHIGAGLIAADLDELTGALVTAKDATGAGLDLHAWGREGMQSLTPLWLLKYLPNMLACHVTIIHDTRGPSNTITCGEASSGLSLGESMRVIQRGSADLCFCGGAESKLNPMAYLRQQLTGRLTAKGNDAPAGAVRPLDMEASGTILGEGGGIVVLEALETFQQRTAQASGLRSQAYCEVLGFCATQTVNPQKRNLEPNEDGRSIASAIRGALRQAEVEPGAIDLVVPFASGVPAWDRAEAAAYRAVFGDRAAMIPMLSTKASVGNCGAGVGGIDVAVAARALHAQTLPRVINRASPLPGASNANVTSERLERALVVSVGFGGQNVAVVLGRHAG